MRPSLRRAALQRFALKMLQLAGALLAFIAIALPTEAFGLDGFLWRTLLLGGALLAGLTPFLLRLNRRPRARATAPSTWAQRSLS